MIERIKENPIKFVKYFSLTYIIASLLMTILYYLIIGRVAFSLATLLGVVISKTPIILFLVYAWKFYGTNKTQVLLSLSYGLSLVLSFFALIQNIRNLRYITYYNSFAMAARYGMVDYILNILFGFIGLGITIFLFVDCLSKFKRLHISKKLVIINAATSVFSFIVGIITDLIFSGSFTIVSVVAILMNLCMVFSLSAYIIFWNLAIDKRNTSPMEMNLKELKELYENGKITSDEYSRKKAELLNTF